MTARIGASYDLIYEQSAKVNLYLLNLDPFSFQQTSKLILKQQEKSQKIEESIYKSLMMGIRFYMHILDTSYLQHSLKATIESLFNRQSPIGHFLSILFQSYLNPFISRPLVQQFPSRKFSLQISFFRFFIFLLFPKEQRCSKMRMVNISQKVNFSRVTEYLQSFLMWVGNCFVVSMQERESISY